MIECRNCREVLHNDHEAAGARCPRCRMPLYERPPGERRPTRDSRKCAVHGISQAIGICTRCGKSMCIVCRTRWQERPACVACVDELLKGDLEPRAAAEHRRLAGSGLGLGIGGWVCGLLGALIASSVSTTQGDMGLAIFGGLLILLSVVPALISVGQSAAALRVRGERVKLAAVALVLSASQLGLLLGVVLRNLWHEM